MPQRTLSAGLVHTPFLEGLPNLLAEKWRQFFSEATQRSNVAAAIAIISEPNVTAAIPLTPIPVSDLAEGLYRVTVYTKIRVPASATSSVQPSVVFTDGSDVCTFVGTANTGNTTTSVSTNTFMVRITEGTPISYQTAYASNLAGMAYDLELVLERISE